MAVSAIIVKGEWTRQGTILFFAKKGHYPCDEAGKINGFFTEEESIESGETSVIEEDCEIKFFANKYNGLAERIDVLID